MKRTYFYLGLITGALVGPEICTIILAYGAIASTVRFLKSTQIIVVRHEV